jgi:hypothetical protein
MRDGEVVQGSDVGDYQVSNSLIHKHIVKRPKVQFKCFRLLPFSSLVRRFLTFIPFRV